MALDSVPDGDDRLDEGDVPTGAIAAIRGALDTFASPTDAEVAVRIAQLGPDEVVARVMSALLSATPDPRAVFADLAGEAVRTAQRAAGESGR